MDGKRVLSSSPDEREAFTVLIPPPNVTGVLHMGHMLNVTIQDVLIRKARLEGKNACWVPGTDHASIATEAKVVKMLREKGIKKSDLSRDEFLDHAFQWKDKYGGIILDQLKMLGASCDWNRTRFTMEPDLQKAVLKAFQDLYKRSTLSWSSNDKLGPSCSDGPFQRRSDSSTRGWETIPHCLSN